MTGDWKEAPLLALCSYLSRGAAPAYIDQGGILVLNQRCIRDQRISFDAARRTDTAKKPVAKERLLRPFDILVNSTGVGTLGRVAQVRELPEPATVDSHVTIVRPDLRLIDPLYLGLVMRCFEPRIEALGEGSTGQTELSRTRLGALRIPVPRRAEQRAIAQILGTLDDKIELNRRMSETLEEMARALFKSWFVDFDPVRAKAEGRDPGLPKHLADLFPDSFEDSELGEIPKGWKVVALPDAIEVNPTRQLRKGEVAPYLDMANMPTKGHTPDLVVDRPYGSGMRFINGDTLVARISPSLENGKTAFVDFLADGQVGWGSTEYIVLRPKPPLPPEFAYCLARSTEFREFAIQSMTGSSGRQRVPAKSLAHYSMAKPTPEIAKQFGNVVKPLFARASECARESRILAALRDTLLPKLVSGELRVDNPTRLLSGAA